MKNFVAEFQDVFTLYLKLAEELTKIMNVDDSKDPQALVRAILENRDCLDRITQMNTRVLQLSDAWQKCRAHLDPESRDKARNLAEAAKAQAMRLQELCSVKTQKLQTTRDKLETNLAETGKGSRYLKSMNPTKSNYPKFIDSLY
jgi:hypothetical protein